ncbi:MAG: hypothetical protein JXR25_07185 [Pontiellaceae bacterium]|nr:hypothetical protein [Pontiellaceae bacterium]MBN2784595.1 hypothetical protein [Pontiellaceae bacterium]
MIKQVITACAVALTLSAGAETFETEDFFAITIPDSWVQVPVSVLENFAEQVESEDASVPPYDYAFQADASAGWLSYPCILVQVRNIGRFASGDLERFAQDAAGDDVNLGGNSTLFMEVREQDGVKILFGRQLTEYGFIEMTGYAPAESFDEYKGIFEETFSTLKIGDEISYKPRFTDNAPVIGSVNLGKVLVICVQASIVGAGLWLVYSLFRRKLKRA